VGLAQAPRAHARVGGRGGAAGAPGGAPGLSESLWPETEASGTEGSEPGRPDPPGRPAARGFVIRTDGASRANPGHASAGAVLIDLARPDAFDPGAPADASISDYLGIQTNNVAEYTAVVRALALARELEAREVRLLLDSLLIVQQLHGRWRVKDAKLKPLNAEALRLLRTFERWTADHVRRAENHAADALCNEAIDRALGGGPASVVVRPSGTSPRGG
jgi:ribonuclease HI